MFVALTFTVLSRILTVCGAESWHLESAVL